LPGLLKVFLSITKYSYLAWFPVANRDRAVLVDAHFFLSLSMFLTGFITVFEWDALFPDHKDYCNLVPLPIKSNIIFAAKLIALSLFVVLFHIAINGIPTLLFPSIVLVKSFIPGTAGWMISPGETLRYFASHAISLFLSTLFIFTSLLTICAAVRLILPAKLVRIASRSVQLALILILLCAFFSGGNADQLINKGNRIIYWLAPFWFLGLYEALIGHHSAVINGLAQMASTAVAVSSLLSVIAYTISYQSSMQKGFQSAGIASYPVTRIKNIWTRVLHKTLLKKSIERASFHFIAQTAFRRNEHMLYWGSFVAVGLAFIFADACTIKSGYTADSAPHLTMLLSFPLIMSFFILVGLRFIFTVPADLHANWIFKITEKQGLGKVYGGVFKFMLCAIFIPLLIVFTPYYMMIWDFRMVVAHIIYAAILSLILIQLLLLHFMKLPFTCSYLPGKANIILLWPVYVCACYLYTYGMTFLERWVIADAKRCVVFVIISGIALWGLKRHHALFLERNDAIRFEEEPASHLNILTIDE